MNISLGEVLSKLLVKVYPTLPAFEAAAGLVAPLWKDCNRIPDTSRALSHAVSRIWNHARHEVRDVSRGSLLFSLRPAMLQCI